MSNINSIFIEGIDIINEKNINIFIEKYSKLFYNFSNIKDIDNIKNINIKGFLYIIDIDTKEQIIHKVGKTDRTIYERISEYRVINIKNIEFINCKLSLIRERLLKDFLINKTNIKPIKGREYFINIKYLLKLLVLIICLIKDEALLIKKETLLLIIKYIIIDINKNEIKDIDNYFISSNFEEILNKDKEKDIFNIRIGNVLDVENHIEPNNMCNFCKKNFSSVSSLNLHKKTANYCLTLQTSLNKIVDSEKIISNDENNFICNYCNKVFNLKTILLKHYNFCKEKNELLSKLDKKDNEIILLKKDNEKIILQQKEKKDNEITLLKEENNKLKEELNKLKEENNNLKYYYEVKIKELENNHLKSLLDDEKNRVNELLTKSNTNINNTTNIQNNIYKDNFDELFEKLPKFTQENLMNSFKDVLNENVLLRGIDNFAKVINSGLGAYAIVTDYSRHKVIVKDKDSNQLKTVTPKIFLDSLNNIEPLTSDLMKKSREKVDTFHLLEQADYITNLACVRDLIYNCSKDQVSDKDISKYGRDLTKNCLFVTTPSASSIFNASTRHDQDSIKDNQTLININNSEPMIGLNNSNEDTFVE
jgi:hypothetical protein